MDYATSGLLSCPTCGLVDFDVLAGPPFPAARCRSCGLGIERHLALPAGAYDFETYARARDNAAATLPSLRWHHDVAVARYRMNQLRPLLPTADGRTWLDVGCGAGAHLAAAAAEGWLTLGVDVSATRTGLYHPAVDTAEWVIGARRAEYRVAASACSFFDSLEHAPEPDALLRAADRDMLVAGAILVIEAPDLDAAVDFAAWKHRRVTPDLTEHIWHFNARSLETMVARYTRNLTLAAVTRPVAGRLQMVWRR